MVVVNTLGAVVVGTGFGLRVHVPALRAADIEVVALVGRDRQKTEQRAKQSGIDVACGSLAEALQLSRSDVIVISTPPMTHAALAEEAVAAGRHVLVEKPFTVSVDEAQRITDAATKAGVVALVGHEFRFSPERVTLLQALRDRLIGTPRLATFVGHNALAAPLDLPSPDWWFDPRRGGGWLGTSVSHLVDATRVWLGEFENVSAVLPMVSDRDPSVQAEDTAAARFRMKSGCEGILQQSVGIWGDRIGIMRVAGPQGSLTLEGDSVKLANAEGTRTLDRVGPPLPIELEPSWDPRDPLAFTYLELGPAAVQAGLLRDLALAKRPVYEFVLPATFADGLACVEVLDAIRRSAANGGSTTSLPASPD
jgi:predicted dehydrogenase